ncbi:hypothetical protein [Stenotrophomonas maltophilia]|uniref:hypothetical protein n=1 Tax=Stenotrophomonas maltophilia TaxID=40324 RepID=UPI0013DC2801|nr:hypothetical protein [Stenotrophomonas maltophilia]
MSEIELKARIISILSGHTREMEGYSYFSSNPGIPEDEYEEIADEVIAAIAPQWQPIESAPKDGRPLLLDHPDWHTRVLRGAWDAHELAWRVHGFGCPATQPTKWQPLPAPPEVEG